MSALQDIKDILRGALASLGGFGGRMVARLALMVIAGQLYGASAVGLLGQVAAITEIMAAVAVLGLKRSLLDMMSAKTANGNASSIAKAALISSLILASFMSFILGLIWPLLFHDTPMPALLYLAVPCIVFAEVGGTAIRFLRIIRWEVIARSILEPWTFFLAALFLFWGGSTETGLLAAYAISAVGAATGIAIGLQRAFGWKGLLTANLDVRSLYRIPVQSFPVGVTDIGIMMFRRIDILVLSLVVGHQATGIYYMAQQIVTVPHKTYQLFEPMMSPVLAKLHHADDRALISAKLAAFCRWIFTLQLALTIPFVIFSGELLGLFGDQFAAGAMVLAVLLIAELLDGSFALGETALVFAKPSLPPRLILGALTIEVVSIYLFASLWGASGAAVGFFLSVTWLAAARLFMLQKHLSIRILSRAFLPPSLFGSLIAGFLLIVRQFVPMDEFAVFGPATVISVILFLAMVRMMALTPADKSILTQLRSG